jgi:hypothetical protein
MPRRVGRPIKPYERTSYTQDEMKVILDSLSQSPYTNSDLREKVKKDIQDRKRLTKQYAKAKERVFGKAPKDNNTQSIKE